MTKKITTIPSYSYQKTSDPNIQRFVDREGNWTHYWLVKEKRFVKAVNHVLRLGFPKGERFYQWLKNANPEEADRKLKSAGEEGTRTHKAIRDLTAGLKVTMATRYPNDITKKEELLSDDEWDNLQAFVNLCEVYKPEFIADEKTVCSVSFGYAGTFDWLGTWLIPEGDKNFPKEVYGKRVLVLPDWKTGSGLWPEYELQISAYLQAILEMGIFKEFLLSSKSEESFGVLVRLGTKHKSGYELKVFSFREMITTKFDLFTDSLRIANSQEPDFEPEIKQIPWSFQYQMKVAKIEGAREKIVAPVQESTAMLPLPTKLENDPNPLKIFKDIVDKKVKKDSLKKKRGRPKKVKVAEEVKAS